MTTTRLIEYASWIRERVTDTELSNDLEDCCAWLLSSGVAKYKLDDDHRITLCVEDWPLLTILAQNSTRIINGQRRFFAEFTRLATELGHSVKIRLVKRKKMDPVICNAPPNLKMSKLEAFSSYDSKERDHLERLVCEDNASEDDKWLHYCYSYMDYFKIRWVDYAFLKRWGIELSCPRRSIFLALLRPFDNLRISGHTEKDALIAKVSDILEITTILGFDHFSDYDHEIEIDLELLSSASFFRNYKESRMFWGLEPSCGPKNGVWNRKQLVTAVTAIFTRCGIALQSTEVKRIKGVRHYTYHLTKESIEEMMELCKLQLQGLQNMSGEYDRDWTETINERYRDSMKSLQFIKYGKYLVDRTESSDEDTSEDESSSENTSSNKSGSEKESDDDDESKALSTALKRTFLKE